jgi:UDP-N-acetylmuramate--alanine ligase
MSSFYFMGIKGAGMSALACLLFDLGHTVKGCDYEEDFYTTAGLEDRGIVIETFENMKIKASMTIIVGNAFEDHELVQKLIKQDYIVFTYSQYLGRMSKEYYSIAISGTHGKTTTTNLCRQLLTKMQEINYVVGDGMGGGNPLSQHLVFEACEYKRHFLNYFPKVAVITNIDYDHPDYYKNIDDVKLAFNDFISNSHFLIYNGDDEHLVGLASDMKKKLSYGLKPEHDFYANNISNNETETQFDVYCKGKFFDTFTMPIFGLHNVSNALAAIALALYMGVKKKDIKEALAHYKGSKRRFEIFEKGSQIIMSDYAHHPTEIKATHEALRLKYKNKKLICIFEPHTFSRTKQFVSEFKEALELYDQVYLKDIFTSVREHDETIRITDLADKIDQCTILKDLDELKMHEDAVLIFMGAGNIDKTAQLYYNSK